MPRLHIQHELTYDRENEEKETIQLVRKEEGRKRKGREREIIPYFNIGTSV